MEKVMDFKELKRVRTLQCLIHTVILMIRPKFFLYFQVHLPSLTVFSNWPTSRTPLRYVHTFDFSPNSGYLSIGNDRGKALLFR